MRDTDYRQAKKLEDVLKISKKDWSIHSETRNNCLMRLAKDSESVSELGVNQGTSFIFMMLQNPKKIVGVDLTLKKWRTGGTYPALEPLALEYMKEHPMEYIMYEGSSTDKESVHNVDMLHIDSLHKASHLRKELKMHAESVNKYIAFHDTKLSNGETGGQFALWRVVEQFLNDNPQWELEEHYTEGKCGHAAIRRV